MAAGAILLESILTSCCHILYWLPASILEDLFQVYDRIYWSLEPKKQGGFIHPQSPRCPSLSRHEPSCNQFLCGIWRHPVSACLETVSGSTQKVRAANLDSMLAGLRHWVKCGPHALKLEIPPQNFPNYPVALANDSCYLEAEKQSFTRSTGRDLGSMNWFFFKMFQNFCECKYILNLTWTSLGKITFWMLFGPLWCSWSVQLFNVHIWWGWMLLASRWKESSSWSGDLGCVFDLFFFFLKFSSPDDIRRNLCLSLQMSNSRGSRDTFF